MENQENEDHDENALQLDNSLTNINWLGRFSCNSIAQHKGKKVTKTKIVKPPRSPSTKRPPYSYSELIKLAINSIPEKQLPLQQIYAWVEEHFPYYKYDANPGWKNSIRHSLSMQDIFVRQTDRNSRTAYWTIKSNPETKSCTSHEQNCLGQVLSGQLNYVPALPMMINVNNGVTIVSPQNKVGSVKKMQALLPRGIAPRLIPVPIFITPSVMCEPSSVPLPTAPITQACKRKRVIAPKLPVSRNSVPGMYSSRECSTQASSNETAAAPESIIAKRWKQSNQPRHHQKRKQKHQTLAEPHLQLQENVVLSTDSGLEIDKDISLGQKTNCEKCTSSPFKTPTKKNLVGLATSTPYGGSHCLSPSGILSSWKTGLTPPKSVDSLLDGSLFKSPGAGSLYTSLGLSALGDNVKTSLDYNNSGKGLTEFSCLGFTPIKSARLSEGSGFDQQNESLPRVFSYFTLPDIGEGTDLANVSWSAFTAENN
ncbi:forkhead box protein M1-like isoform X1 [Acipenser ruthenus]|uniref:forkhead box protein M1-like isoform X1 n=1 Tax=Acipenser ruthenus TaxID=7906 RepID=UPI0027405C39|nr:forkhead box protein M1-like isoform X1 [Acipenser ruthenus]XP_058858310.1 forkhead box protein M1-like isoform X1 [Acipenser ruthenus]XP_058858311.1 forkhead box protein M1-like isoform X1 [Acipenser ruthenus]XP_058858312.1 forkhead box protein M1-like isoform X1 [Acipenser ruthenus]